MCGVFAYVKRGLISPQQLEELKRYFSLIQHRGPDHSSLKIIEKDTYTIVLGFHRLAIIDPAKETMNLLCDDGVYLACNGEIYNYRHLIDKCSLPVKTGSDCEVILQLYRKQGDPKKWLEELDGVFAFVLYDRKRDLLYVSRDRTGVRPLFEGCNPEKLCYASEGKAVVLNNAAPYRPGLLTVLDLRVFKGGQESWLKEGEYLNIERVTAQKIIKELFIESVRKRLMSDRPVGFLVSGGLDSSLVAAVSQRLLGKKITTFSIGLSESPDLVAARKVAEYLDSDHHEVVISVKDILEALPETIRQLESYDITTVRASIPMYLISRYINQHTEIKVIFSGEGADELFGGYLYFHDAPDHQEFHNETERLMRELYKYDVLRGDRTVSGWGLELRVPFLDAALQSFVRHIDPKYLMPGEWGIEKAIIRDAFSGYLPDEILHRQKEAFSDGVGYNSVTALKEYASKSTGRVVEHYPNTARPQTDEAELYYYLFRQYYPNRRYLHTGYYWMPKWNGEVDDPSATVLNTHLCKNVEHI